MRWKLQLRIMFLSLRRGGFRSVSALGAVGLGIAAMMIMLALGTGAERELQAIAGQMGTNLFMIKAGQVLAPPGRGQGWFTSSKLQRRDILFIDAELGGIRTMAPILEGSVQAKFNRKALVTTVRGVTPTFVDVRNFRLDEGRLLDENDGASRSRVALVGPFVADRLNDGFSLVGETLLIAGIPFEVVGQLSAKGMTAEGQNEDDQILIPLETARRRVFNAEYLSRVLVQVEDAMQLPRVQTGAREVLRTSHRLDENIKDDFEILELIRANQIKSMNTAFAAGLSQLFAAMLLVIGSAGVLAVTFLNIKERTAEIGLRMAVGARSRDIARLIVAEACVLSVLGGVAGVAAGMVRHHHPEADPWMADDGRHPRGDDSADGVSRPGPGVWRGARDQGLAGHACRGASGFVAAADLRT